MAAHSLVYEVYTDLDPDELHGVGLEIFRLWVEFAMGRASIGGKTIMHPTGRYASSISYRRFGYSRVAIVANEKLAPEAKILETGHGEIDLKTKLTPGRAYPLHRGTKMAPVLARRGARIWAKVRSSGFNGYARVPERVTAENAGSWIIPPMPAYSPAKILAQLAANGQGNA